MDDAKQQLPVNQPSQAPQQVAGDASNNQTTGEQVQSQQTSGQVQEPVAEPAAPPAPVSVPFKEAEPGGAVDSADLLKHSEVSPELPAEVKEAGVEEVHEAHEVAPDIKKLGVELVAEAQKPALSPSGTASFPLTQKEARHILAAHKKIADSLVWLAALVAKQFKKTETAQNTT